jgi:hypothetical protein
MMGSMDETLNITVLAGLASFVFAFIYSLLLAYLKSRREAAERTKLEERYAEEIAAFQAELKVLESELLISNEAITEYEPENTPQ